MKPSTHSLVQAASLGGDQRKADWSQWALDLAKLSKWAQPDAPLWGVSLCEWVCCPRSKPQLSLSGTLPLRLCPGDFTCGCLGRVGEAQLCPFAPLPRGWSWETSGWGDTPGARLGTDGSRGSLDWVPSVHLGDGQTSSQFCGDERPHPSSLWSGLRLRSHHLHRSLSEVIHPPTPSSPVPGAL